MTTLTTILSGVFGKLAGPVVYEKDFLPDLENVGYSKIIGYLPLLTIEEATNKTVSQLMAEAQERGMAASLFNRFQTTTYSGALYVYDRQKLKDFLNEPQNSMILKKTRWSSDPDKFINQLACYRAKSRTPLYKLISFAFGHPNEQYEGRPVYEDAAPGL